MKVSESGFPAFVLFLAVVTFGGCAKSDFERDAFLRTSWHTSILDGGPGGYPPLVLALANDDLADSSRSVSLGDRAQVFLVPYLSGYSVIVLSKAKVGPAEEKAVRQLVDRALKKAADSAATFEKKALKEQHL